MNEISVAQARSFAGTKYQTMRLLSSSAPDAANELYEDLHSIIRERRLTPHYQPIVRLRAGEILGYEGLIRGPSDSYLHSPVALIEAADRLGLLVELERCALRVLARGFVEQGLPGQLFLNVSSEVLLAGVEQRLQMLLDELDALELAPQRIVIELTENKPASDYPRLRRVFNLLRTSGFGLAIDDLGEGFASLRRWVELRPGYVKIDRYFIEGLHRDPLKQQFVRALASIAADAQALVIAEGIETADELHVLQDLGFSIGQGYLFGRPHPQPAPSIAPDLSMRLFGKQRGFESRNTLARDARRAGGLAIMARTVAVSASCNQVHQHFVGDPESQALPVLDTDSRPVGLLRRVDVMELMSKPFMRERYGKRPCSALMSKPPLIFDACTSLQTMSEAVVATDARRYSDGFLVTRDGVYCGMGTIPDLMRAITEVQIHTARYANPLTLLPGNVPLDDWVDTLLEAGENFVVAYFDLDCFKPFNDLYGYRSGDEVIQFTARVLSESHDRETDFLGHVGGDDFVVVYRSTDWEARISEALERFEMGKSVFFAEDHLDAGGYTSLDRQGAEVFHALVTLSAGVVPIGGGRYANHVAVSTAAAEVKRLAKRQSGSSYFVERRQPGEAPRAAPQ